MRLGALVFAAGGAIAMGLLVQQWSERRRLLRRN